VINFVVTFLLSDQA